MKRDPISLLLISPDEQFQAAVRGAVTGEDCIVTGATETIVGLNGRGAALAAAHDIILFDVDAGDPSVIGAARSLCDARKPGATIIALAGDDLPLCKTRELRHVGVEEVLPREALEQEVLPQIEAFRTRRRAQLPELWNGCGDLGKVIAVAQSRGGVGASTLAVNLANELQGKRGVFRKAAQFSVVVVDLDFQFGSVAALLDVEETDTLWRLAMDQDSPDGTFLDQAVVQADCGLSVLTAPSRYGPLTALAPEQISAIIGGLRKTFDYVVIDLPHALVDWVSPVLAEADRLLLVTDVTVPSVRSARKLMDFYLKENPGLDVQLVAGLEKKPLFMAAHHKAASELLKKDFSYWIPRDQRAARQALDRGAPLSEIAARSAMARAIRGIAAETVKDMPLRGNAHELRFLPGISGKNATS